MAADAGRLPFDVLVKVFSYLPFNDLMAVQSVCCWWQQVSRDKVLWRDIVYKPKLYDKAELIIRTLRACPELRAVDLDEVHEGNISQAVVDEMMNGCPNLQELTITNEVILSVQGQMEKIKTLKLVKGYLKCKRVPFAIGKDCLMTIADVFPNLEHLDCRCPISDYDISNYLVMKGRSLHTLGVPCSTRDEECVLSFLDSCENLKNLSLSSDCDNLVDVMHNPELECLSNLTSLTMSDCEITLLQCYTNSNRRSPPGFPSLLELNFGNISFDRDCRLTVVATHCPSVNKLTFSNQKFPFMKTISDITAFESMSCIYFLRCSLSSSDWLKALNKLPKLTHIKVLESFSDFPIECLMLFCRFPKLNILKFDLMEENLPYELSSSSLGNPRLALMFYNCADHESVDRLRSQHLSVTLLSC